MPSLVINFSLVCITMISILKCNFIVRDAGAGGAGGARAPPSVGISVTPIRTKGADYARHITTVPPHHFGRCGVSAPRAIEKIKNKKLENLSLENRCNSCTMKYSETPHWPKRWGGTVVIWRA